MTDQEALNRFKADLKFMADIATPGHTTNQMQMYERAVDALEYKIAHSERTNT